MWGTGTVGWFSCVRVYGWCSYGPRSCSCSPNVAGGVRKVVLGYNENGGDGLAEV